MRTITDLLEHYREHFNMFNSTNYLFTTTTAAGSPTLHFGRNSINHEHLHGANRTARIRTMTRSGPHVIVSTGRRRYHIFPTTAAELDEVREARLYLTNRFTKPTAAARMMHALATVVGDRPCSGCHYFTYETTMASTLIAGRAHQGKIDDTLTYITNDEITAVLTDISNSGGRFTINSNEMTQNPTAYVRTTQTLLQYIFRVNQHPTPQANGQARPPG